MFSWLLLLLSLRSFSWFVSGLQFGYTPPTQCDSMTIHWVDGEPPYELLLVPVFNTATKVPISSSSSNGSFSFQLGLAAGQQFLLTMSDATSFASGGVSALLTVGSSISHANCSTAIPLLKFTFILGETLEQCGSFNVSGYGNATQPVIISALIPNKTPLQLRPPSGPSDFVWNPVDVAAGDEIVFFVTDANGDFGGTSHLIPVQSTSDQSCLNNDSPQPESNAPTPIPVSPTGPTDAPQATVTLVPKASNAGAIGGAIAGILVVILLLGTLVTFIYRHRKAKQNLNGFDNRPHPNGFSSTTDITQPSAPWSASADYIAEPFRLTSVSENPFTSPSSLVSGHDDFDTPNPWSALPDTSTTHDVQMPQPQTSTSSKSRSNAFSQRPTRFILHTDAEIDQDVEEIELPPQYSDRFAPPPNP